jgi:AmiR/NasT family two-component response regulator
VRLDADHLVVQRARSNRVEEDPYAVTFHHLVVGNRLGRLLDLELDLTVGLDPANAQRAHLAERIDGVFGDLEHRAIVCAAMRILIAEDETIIRLDLRDLLERAGHEVVAEARDGEEAVSLAREHEPELAVMDVRMPKLDGIEAAKTILAERPIPIVMLTAYGQEELVARAVEAGVFGYLVKPFREQDLVPAIATARARHEELAAVREEAESLADALAARKAIERAKGLLMEKEGLSETEAFARLRKASQLSGRPLKVIAEAVIATLDPS